MTRPARMLPLKDAANYCGIPARRFPAECEVPPVEMPHGKRLYDIRDLDTWLDGLKGNSLNENAILERLAK